MNQDRRTAWLKDLRVGDYVGVVFRGSETTSVEEAVGYIRKNHYAST